MMTSPNNVQMIERYLQGQLSPVDRLVFEAHMLAQPALQTEVHFQRKVFDLIRMYHRKKLKEELETVHQRLFNDPRKRSFRQKIEQIFKTELR